MGQLEEKVAIITGGGTGIGKGIAKAFAREGADLVLAARTKSRLDSTAEEVRALGATAVVAPTDVTDEAQVIALFERTIQEFGRVDILVNNSGTFDGGPLDELTLETWQKVLDVNLTGPFLCSREAMKIMKRQGGGRIVNIGSISAQKPRMHSAPYSTTKRGLAGLTHATALEGRDFGVVASCLHPGNTTVERGTVVSDQNAEPRMNAEDIASAALAMVALPLNVNMYEAIVLPTTQAYLGRG